MKLKLLVISLIKILQPVFVRCFPKNSLLLILSFLILFKMHKFIFDIFRFLFYNIYVHCTKNTREMLNIMDKILAIFLSLRFILPVITTQSWDYLDDCLEQSETFLKDSDPDYYTKLTIGKLWEGKLSEIEAKTIKPTVIPHYSHNVFETAYNLPHGGLSLDKINLSEKEKSNLKSLQEVFEKYRSELAYSQEANEKNESRISLFHQILKDMKLEAPNEEQGFSLLADGVIKLSAGTCLGFSSLLTQEGKKKGVNIYTVMTLETIDENVEIESNHAFNIVISDNKEVFASDLTYAICEEKTEKSVCFLMPLKNYIAGEFFLRDRTIDSYNVAADNKIIPLPEFLRLRGVAIQ